MTLLDGRSGTAPKKFSLRGVTYGKKRQSKMRQNALALALTLSLLEKSDEISQIYTSSLITVIAIHRHHVEYPHSLLQTHPSQPSNLKTPHHHPPLPDTPQPPPPTSSPSVQNMHHTVHSAYLPNIQYNSTITHNMATTHAASTTACVSGACEGYESQEQCEEAL